MGNLTVSATASGDFHRCDRHAQHAVNLKLVQRLILIYSQVHKFIKMRYLLNSTISLVSSVAFVVIASPTPESCEKTLCWLCDGVYLQ